MNQHRRPLARTRLLAPAALLAAAAALTVADAARKRPPAPVAPAADPPEASEPAVTAATQQLGGAERYLAVVATDKPVYRGGEKVYFRCTVLNAGSRKPAGAAGAVLFKVTGPKGETVHTGFAELADSVAGSFWEVPAGQAGGTYQVVAQEPNLGTPPAERSFDVRAYRAPRLKTQIEFVRDGYGPGDTVAASVTVARAEGGVPADAPVTVTARVDGAEVHRSSAVVTFEGTCSARFELPAEIARGEGTLAFAIEDGGVVETAAKTIPILLQTVDLMAFPEGGDLVAGLPNRVYLEVRTPAQKPADVTGVVVDAEGRPVAAFRTEHEGRGRFTFTPLPDRAYALKITEPAGIKGTFPLPPVARAGVVLSAPEEVYPAGGKIQLAAGSHPPGAALSVTLSKREVELARAAVPANPVGALAGVEFVLAGEADAAAEGVLTATLWGADGHPLAERLIYREPARSIKVSVTADRPSYTPGGKAVFKVKATDEAGRPVAAVVGLTVTDDSVLEMVERREQAPRLPVMVLLEPEVRELADAQVYLDPENAEAPRALDLLLGTQGWRRFASADVAAFLKRHGDDARRALAQRTPTQQAMTIYRDFGLVDESALFSRLAASAERASAAVDQNAVPGNRFEEHPAAIPPPAGAAAEPEAAPPLPRDAVVAAAKAEDAAAAAPVPEEERARGRNRGRVDGLEEVADLDQPAERQLEANREAEAPVEALGLLFEDAEARGGRRMRLAKQSRAGWIRPMPTVRVYAHQLRSGRAPGDRVDFTETLYWHAGLKTDAATGEAEFTFALSDAVTAFRVSADAFDGRGALGAGSALAESVEPFYVEPKLPLEVTAGDRIEVGINLVNATDAAFDEAVVELTAAEGIEVTAHAAPAALAAGERARRTVGLTVGADVVGTGNVVVGARAGALADKVTRPLRVVPRGFPVELAQGGLLNPDSGREFPVAMPASRVPGSVSARVVVYPTPMASLTEALARLIREPNGCFEQTSSTTYPLVMAQQYFLSHQGVDPALVSRSHETLGRGYQRLVSFECKQKGYEWFGADPGHEALTAYGLMQFTDLAEVREVDAAMLARTRSWLLGTRDGKGGFERKRRALHTWIADPDCSNAYITWSLLESGETADSLRGEIATVLAAARASDNSYVVALGANVAQLAGDRPAATELRRKLAAAQEKGGQVGGATTSIVGSGGLALQVETTSLAVLAWLGEEAFTGNVEPAIKWLAESCKGGRFGSTQSTVLALKAIVAYDAARSHPKAPGRLMLFVDGKQAGSPVAFDQNASGPIELTDLSEMIGQPGEHLVELQMEGGSPMPFSFAVDFHDDQPPSDPDCALGLSVALPPGEIEEGGITEARVVVSNRTEKSQPTPVAIVGIPGGLEVRHDQLKELVKAGTIAAYEVIGREVVLYWRDFAPQQEVELPLDLVAAVPGAYTAPASRAYLYYTDESKTWTAPLAAVVR